MLMLEDGLVRLERMAQEAPLLLLLAAVAVQPGDMMQQAGDEPRLLADRLGAQKRELVAEQRLLPRPLAAEAPRLPGRADLLEISFF